MKYVTEVFDQLGMIVWKDKDGVFLEMNQMALDAAGITKDTEVPVGGEMRLGSDGEPNGLFLNRGVQLLSNAIPAPSDETLTNQLLIGLNQMAEDGYTAVHDAGLNSRAMAVLEKLEAEDRLPIRVYAMLSLRDEDLIHKWLEKGPDTDNDSMLVTRTVKAYYDGALGSRGARLLYDYSDQPGHQGVIVAAVTPEDDQAAALVP